MTLLTLPLLFSIPADASGYRVVGGAPADEGRWPDTAAVYVDGQVGCTGVLIAPNLVLTAGHCTDGDIDRVKLDTVDFRGEFERVDVAEVIPYPQWWNTYDLALLVLEEDSRVAPRQIAMDCEADEFMVDGAAVAIVGFGATDEWGEQYGSKLREATTTITDADCTDTNAGCLPSVSPGGELGAGGDGVDACFGDSGGPLYLLTQEGAMLAGITSRAYDTANLPCSEGGIYVRPDAVIEWIEQESGVRLPRPQCDGSVETGDQAGGSDGQGFVDTKEQWAVRGCSSASSSLPAGAGAWMVGLFGLLLAARRRAAGAR